MNALGMRHEVISTPYMYMYFPWIPLRSYVQMMHGRVFVSMLLSSASVCLHPSLFSDIILVLFYRAIYNVRRWRIFIILYLSIYKHFIKYFTFFCTLWNMAFPQKWVYALQFRSVRSEQTEVVKMLSLKPSSLNVFMKGCCFIICVATEFFLEEKTQGRKYWN